MQIEINDNKIECEDGLSLAEVLRQQKVQTAYVAVAVDYTVVPKTEWENVVLHDGSKIIIIKAVQGG
ncbi:MAG: sulfur carrier protein ThiS [Paludibacteraceae bacterium]|nr:sulfur carrier protein ThiS [Paludibacteraceae bacterium]MCQ2217521.1 sulfur carrier protein ThiS [Paludibacteraceae bacterium]